MKLGGCICKSQTEERRQMKCWYSLLYFIYAMHIRIKKGKIVKSTVVSYLYSIFWVDFKEEQATNVNKIHISPNTGPMDDKSIRKL